MNIEDDEREVAVGKINACRQKRRSIESCMENTMEKR